MWGSRLGRVRKSKSHGKSLIDPSVQNDLVIMWGWWECARVPTVHDPEETGPVTSKLQL